MVTLDGASTARGARGLLRAPGAVPGSGADTGPLDSGGGLGQRGTRELTLSPRAAVAGGPPQAFLIRTKENTMRLGIDYGTTRTVVAAVDRGNYPVVSFHTAEGDTQDWYPSLITARGDERLYGLDAARHQDDPDWALLRSFKRQVATLGPAAQMPLGTGAVTALELLAAFLAQLRRDLVTRSNLRLTPQEPLVHCHDKIFR
jgi:hypothetical protein